MTHEEKKARRSRIIMWIVCIGIIVAGAIIVIVDKMPEDVSYSKVKCDQYITLGEYKGVKVEKEKVAVTDKDVKAEINSRVQQQATTKAVKKGIVKDGDTVNINYEGTINGEKFIGGSADDQELIIGSGSMIDGFEKGLVGKSIGETVKLNLKFPKDYKNNMVAGKAAVFTVTINSKQIPVTYKYDETFLKKFTKYTNKKDYEAAVKKELLKERKQEAEDNAKDSAWGEVTKNVKVKKYPKKQYLAAKEMARQSAKTYSDMYGISESDFVVNYMGVTEKDYEKQLKETAKESVKEQLAAHEIAKKENITVTNEESVKWLKKQIKNSGMSEKDFEEQNGTTVKKFAKQKETKDQVLLEEVKDYVYDNAKVTEK